MFALLFLQMGTVLVATEPLVVEEVAEVTVVIRTMVSVVMALVLVIMVIGMMLVRDV